MNKGKRNNRGTKMRKPSLQDYHDKMERAGIKHLCHFDDAGSRGLTGLRIPQGDLSSAGRLCSECRIAFGWMTIDHVLTGKLDPSSPAIALEQAIAQKEARDWDKLSQSIPFTVIPPLTGIKVDEE